MNRLRDGVYLPVERPTAEDSRMFSKKVRNPMQEKIMRWEYKTVTLGTGGFMGGKFESKTLDAMLNELGRDGWEMVSAFDTSQGAGMPREIVAIFKRQTSS